MMTIEELRRALEDETAHLRVDIPAERVRRRARGIRRRRGLVAVAGSALAVVTAGGAVALAVPTPVLPALGTSTTLYYSDGTTVLAQLGPVNRTVLNYDEFQPAVTQAAVAAEDPSFWDSDRGGITRAVLRHAANAVESGPAAKVASNLQAWKLSASRSKEEILAYYLNATDFGRGAAGVEAAAEAYFDKSARRSAPPDKQLSTAEAIMLMTLVRQPSPDPDKPDASPGFDPANGPGAEQNSRQRWAEIRDGMVALNYLSSEDASRLSYPEPIAPPSGPRNAGYGGPAGLVINHVLDELSHTDGSSLRGLSWEAIGRGGYAITTTIDARAQQVLEQAADETVGGSVMHGQPVNLQAAGAVVEPGTGRVLAYFGGHDGAGSDYAGFYVDENGEATGVGRHPPGASFMVYTLAAALKAGYSLQSHWQWQPHAQLGRPAENPIRNYSTCDSDMDKSQQPARSKSGACSLMESTALSLNVPLYDVTVSLTPGAVLTMARDAGIDTMWTDNRERIDLHTADVYELTPRYFDLVLGIGQYPVTVLDQANSMATFAAGGLRARAHFVRTVSADGQLLYSETLPAPDQPRLLNASQLADLGYALRDTAGTPGLALKTGSWQYGPEPQRERTRVEHRIHEHARRGHLDRQQGRRTTPPRRDRRINLGRGTAQHHPAHRGDEHAGEAGTHASSDAGAGVHRRREPARFGPAKLMLRLPIDQARVTVAPRENAESCSSSLVISTSFGTSKTIVPVTFLPGSIVLISIDSPALAMTPAPESGVYDSPSESKPRCTESSSS